MPPPPAADGGPVAQVEGYLGVGIILWTPAAPWLLRLVWRRWRRKAA
ncbi:hypothetical protein [Nitrospirillum sp. BR 11163]|nr:hypothetical protein [Nitrospirillum sp. BR 11163]MEA1674170.1 hypothetical protein [Nitrospirillum sp. BR 11163]